MSTYRKFNNAIKKMDLNYDNEKQDLMNVLEEMHKSNSSEHLNLLYEHAYKTLEHIFDLEYLRIKEGKR